MNDLNKNDYIQKVNDIISESKKIELTQDSEPNTDWGFYKFNSFCDSGLSIEDDTNQSQSNSIKSLQNSMESLDDTDLKNILAETHYMNRKLIGENDLLISENKSYKSSVIILERRIKSLQIKIEDLRKELKFNDEIYNLDVKNQLFVPFGISFMIGSIIGGIGAYVYLKLR